MNKTYLGDGIYAEMYSHTLKLTTEDGINTFDTIYIDPEVWLALQKFVNTPTEGIPHGTST